MARKQAPSALVRASQAAMASGEALGGAVGLRERLLEMAGVTEAEQAMLTRVAINTYVKGLKATKKQRLVVNQGLNVSVVETYEDEDYALQARSADALLDRFGVVVSKSAASLTGGGDLIVNVHKLQPPSTVVIDAQVADIVGE